MRFSAATAAENILPERLAQRAQPWAERLDARISTADARGPAGRMSLIAFGSRLANAFIAFSQVLWRKRGVVMAVFLSSAPRKERP